MRAETWEPMPLRGVTDVAARDAALRRLVDGGTARRGYAIAWDLLRDRAEAEDAVQEALARVCESLGDLREVEALDGWFLRILANHCLRTLRRRRLGDWVRRVFVGEPEVIVDGERPDPEPRADDALASARAHAGLLAEVARLPPMQRAAVVLRYGHDQAVEEIAAMLGVGAETVKTHLSRGLARLRGALATKDGSGEGERT